MVSGLLAAGFVGVIAWLWWADRAERLARQEAKPLTTVVTLETTPPEESPPEESPPETILPEASPPEAIRESASEAAPAGPAPEDQSSAATAASGEAAEDAAAADQPAIPPPPPPPASSADKPIAAETTEPAEPAGAEPGTTAAGTQTGPETGTETETSTEIVALVPPRVAAPPPPPAVEPERDRVVLAPAPDPGLILETENGRLPIIGADGRRPWQVYRRPFSAPIGEPRIAIIVGDMGLSAPATNAAIQQLPGPITLAFAPYAQGLDDWIAQARAGGHEVMLQLPMEPFDYPNNDPGPHALLTSLSAGSNLERLEWLLGRFVGYVGVTNYMGSKFTTSAEAVEPILESLAARGLMFIDARASGNSVAWRVAQRIGLPQAVNDRYLDNVASRAAIDTRLAELEQIAARRGTAVGIGFPYPVTLERVARWAPTLKAKGIHLAPASAVVNRQLAE